MFDIGFWELAVIGVIALLVVGPERLPALARNVGMWVGRIRRYVAHVKQDIERELHAEEVRELLERRNGLSEIRDVARETASALDDARKELDSASRQDSGTSEELTAEPAAAPSPGTRRPPADPLDAANLASVSPAEVSSPPGEPTAEPPSSRDDEDRPGRQG